MNFADGPDVALVHLVADDAVDAHDDRSCPPCPRRRRRSSTPVRLAVASAMILVPSIASRGRLPPRARAARSAPAPDPSLTAAASGGSLICPSPFWSCSFQMAVRSSASSLSSSGRLHAPGTCLSVFASLRHVRTYCARRATNLVFTESLWDASRIASRAVFSSMPSISNSTLPGLTTATQASGRPFALAHARFGRLLRDRLVGEDAHPDLPAALDEARDRDAGRLDLPRGDPAVLQGLQAVVAEARPCSRSWPSRSAVPRCCFRNFTFPGHQHGVVFLPACALAARVVGETDLARLAPVDPDLDADDAVGRARLGEPVVDLRAQRVERQAALRDTAPCARSRRRPSRPPTCTLIPLAPKRCATRSPCASRAGRRRAFRAASRSPPTTSWASISGLSISRMLMNTSRCVRFRISSLRRSTSPPLRPMMMPGREVRMLTLSLLAARSISIADTPAWPSRFLSSFRSFRSSWSSSAYFFEAYQRERHVLLKPMRKPYG